MPATQETLNRMASDIFELYQLIATARSRKPSGPDELSEAEFLTLDTLTKAAGLTIGEIQKRVGVLPAQMSRIIRSLEQEGGKGFVDCKINAQDRRRIDVDLTDAGKAAHGAFRDLRLGSMRQILSILEPNDRVQLMRIVGLLTTGLQQYLSAESSNA